LSQGLQELSSSCRVIFEERVNGWRKQVSNSLISQKKLRGDGMQLSAIRMEMSTISRRLESGSERLGISNRN
jgi:hypothetical protein